ncbi:MAG: helix-turn-helix domain-containing protein [Candidatus Nomurabacteria bacterium]
MERQNIQKIETFLKKLGLSEKEIKVYLYILFSGPQYVTKISQSCKLTRTNTYDIIKKLEEKGLSHSLGSEYGKKIKANSPTELKELINSKEREIKSYKNELEDILIGLEKINIKENNNVYNVSYFKGKENLKKMLNLSLLSKNKEIFFAGSELDMINILGEDFLINFHKKRIEKKIKLSALRPGNIRGKKPIFVEDIKNLREVRIRPENQIRLKSVLIIWDNFISFCSFNEEDMFATLIENELISKTQLSWFNFIWEKSKKVK